MWFRQKEYQSHIFCDNGMTCYIISKICLQPESTELSDLPNTDKVRSHRRHVLVNIMCCVSLHKPTVTCHVTSVPEGCNDTLLSSAASSSKLKWKDIMPLVEAILLRCRRLTSSSDSVIHGIYNYKLTTNTVNRWATWWAILKRL